MSIDLLPFLIKLHPIIVRQHQQPGKDRIRKLLHLFFIVQLHRETFIIVHPLESPKFIILLSNQSSGQIIKGLIISMKRCLNRANLALALDIPLLMLHQLSRILSREWEQSSNKLNILLVKAKSSSNHTSKFHKPLLPGFLSRRRRIIKNRQYNSQANNS